MPRGLSAGGLGWGSQTRRTGAAGPSRVKVRAHVRRCGGVKDLLPSTPGVFLPGWSWVTFRTARSFADQECLHKRWRLRPVVTSSRPAARSMRVCSVHSCRWMDFQGSVCQLSLGVGASVCLAWGLLLVP